MRRDSSVGLETRYELEGVGIEFSGGGNSAPVQNGAGAHPAFYTMGTTSFPRVEQLGRGINYKPHLASRFKKA
jgi:hypothetical protein